MIHAGISSVQSFLAGHTIHYKILGKHFATVQQLQKAASDETTQALSSSDLLLRTARVSGIPERHSSSGEE